jgi:hypothetical protein
MVVTPFTWCADTESRRRPAVRIDHEQLPKRRRPRRMPGVGVIFERS